MGILVNHPVDKASCPIVSPVFTPAFDCLCEEKRIFLPRKDDPTKKFPIRIAKNALIVTTVFGDSVTFTKSNRGQSFHDSRQKKPISASECLAELVRLLDNKEVGERAFRQLENV